MKARPTTQVDADIFGASQMGYVIVESNELDEWRRFLKQGLGLHEASATDAVAFRMDAHARRFIVRRGSAEDVVAIGYQLRDAATLKIVQRRLGDRGITVETGDAQEAAQRGVKSFLRLKGPKGLAIELFTEALLDDAPLSMLTSGFETGDGGMGHVAMTTRLPEKVERFYQEIFDARLSDRVSQKLGGVMLDISFLRLNDRHHSVAVAATRGLRVDPIRTRVQHVNLIASALEDVSGAFERLRDLGYEMAHEIGQHPNDHGISFYVFSPSGFEVELGWNPVKVDEASWKAGRHYDAISTWGHRPEKASGLDMLLLNLGNFQRGIRSLLKPEFSPL